MLKIVSEVGSKLLYHLETAAMEILGLIPDLLLGCLEAALDIITGFGSVITAARILKTGINAVGYLRAVGAGMALAATPIVSHGTALIATPQSLPSYTTLSLSLSVTR